MDRSTGTAPPATATVRVVVPTHDRSGFLPDVIEALRRQTQPDFEVVLVDDGSADDTVAVARAAIAGDDRFRLVSTPNRGPAAARNTGWRDARTEWVAFTDDDCIPDPTWLARLVAAGARADVVQGRTIPEVAAARERLPWFYASHDIGSWSGRFQTCNLLVRTARLRATDGFDESFPPRGFGEDTDLGLRLVAAGAATAFAEHAVVQHRIHPMTYLDFLRRRYRWSEIVRLVAVNPRGREIFPLPYVAHRSHLAFWLALPVAAWAIRTGRWSIPAAALVVYSGHRARVRRRDHRRLPTRLALGATELGGVAVGAIGFVIASARHRRLLL